MCPYEKLRLMLLSMHLSPGSDNKLMKCHFLPLDNVQRRQPVKRQARVGLENEKSNNSA